MVPNHSVLNRKLIGKDDCALYCMTDDITCCGTPPRFADGGSGNELGDWYFQNNKSLQSRTENLDYWYTSWLTGAVLMNYHGDDEMGKTGLFRCDIQDSAGTTHQLYACIYGGHSTCKAICNKMYLLSSTHTSIAYMYSYSKYGSTTDLMWAYIRKKKMLQGYKGRRWYVSGWR